MKGVGALLGLPPLRRGGQGGSDLLPFDVLKPDVNRSNHLAAVSTTVSFPTARSFALHLTSTSGSRIVRMVFDVELADPTHLSSLLAALKGVDGVFDAFRQLPGQNKNS